MALFTAKYAAYNELLAKEISCILPLCIARIVGTYEALTEHDYLCKLVSFFPPNGIAIYDKRSVCYLSPLLKVYLDINTNNSRPFIYFKYNGDYGLMLIEDNKTSEMAYFDSYEDLAIIPDLIIYRPLGGVVDNRMLADAFARMEEIFAEMPVWPIRPVRPSRTCTIS